MQFVDPRIKAKAKSCSAPPVESIHPPKIEISQLLKPDYLYKQSINLSTFRMLIKTLLQNQSVVFVQFKQNSELFLNRLYKVYADGDSLLRRWAMDEDGRLIIDTLFSDPVFLHKCMQHDKFFSALCAIYELGDEVTSALYGLSCASDLKTLGRIISVLYQLDAKDKIFSRIKSNAPLIEAAIFLDRNGLMPSDDGDVDGLDDKLDSVIINFSKWRGNKAVFKIIEGFFGFMLGDFPVPANWKDDSDGLSEEWQPASQSTSRKKKKGGRTIDSMLSTKDLFDSSKTEASCKDLVQFFKSKEALFNQLIGEARFLDLIFETHPVSSSRGSDYSESIFYRWLRSESLLPQLEQIISQEKNPIGTMRDHPRALDALFAVSLDNITAFHVMFQRKQATVWNYFKPTFIDYVTQNPEKFLLLCLNPVPSKSTTDLSCLFSDILNYEIETKQSVMNELLTEANQSILLAAINRIDLKPSVNSDTFIGVINSFKDRYPGNEFFNVFFFHLTQQVLKQFRDSQDNLIALFQTKEKRNSWIRIFQLPAFQQLWYQFDLDAYVDQFLMGCQLSIYPAIKSSSEKKLGSLLKIILSHPQGLAHLRKNEARFSKLMPWVAVNTEISDQESQENLSQESSNPESVIKDSQECCVIAEPIVDQLTPILQPSSLSEELPIEAETSKQISVSQIAKEIEVVAEKHDSAKPETESEDQSIIVKSRHKHRRGKPRHRRSSTVKVIDSQVIAQEVRTSQLNDPTKQAEIENIWNILILLEENIQQKNLTAITPQQIRLMSDFFSDEINPQLLSQYIDEFCTDHPCVKAGEKTDFFVQTQALHTIYLLHYELIITDLSSLLNQFCESVEPNSWLMQTLIHQLVAYYRKRPIDNQEAKDLLIQWIALNQDSSFFKEFIVVFLEKNTLEISETTKVEINKLLDDGQSTLHEFKLYYLYLQFAIQSDLLITAQIQPVMTFFTKEYVCKFSINAQHLSKCIKKLGIALPESCADLAIFVSEVFMVSQISTLCNKYQKDAAGFLREHMKLLGVNPLHIEDKIQDAMLTIGRELAARTTLMTPSIFDAGNELIGAYIPLDKCEIILSHQYGFVSYLDFFRESKEIIDLISKMVSNGLNLQSYIVGSQALRASQGLRFDLAKDLDFDVLSCNRSMKELAAIDVLAESSRLWLNSLVSFGVQLAQIQNCKNRYDPIKRIAWCSFQAKIGSTHLDFRFLYTPWSKAMTEEFSARERCITVRAHLWDLAQQRLRAPIEPCVGFTKPISELTINNITYALWTLASYLHDFKRPILLSRTLAEILKKVLVKYYECEPDQTYINQQLIFKQLTPKNVEFIKKIDKSFYQQLKGKMAGKNMSLEQVMGLVKGLLVAVGPTATRCDEGALRDDALSPELSSSSASSSTGSPDSVLNGP